MNSIYNISQLTELIRPILIVIIVNNVLLYKIAARLGWPKFSASWYL